MGLVFRILAAIIGAMSLLGTAQHWFKLDSLPAERGIKAIGAIGQANIRADVGGIFLAIGLFALIAAWRRSAYWALATVVLVGSTLTGRIVSLIIDGAGPRIFAPMAIEAVVLLIMLGAFFNWRKVPEGL